MKSTSLQDRWKQFLSIVLDPWVIILLIASAYAGVQAANQTDPKSIALMTFIAAVGAGVLGGVLAKRWSDITEERVIVARGKTAVRGLKLLLSNIAHLEKRARVFLERYTPTGETQRPDETTLAFEEVVGRCRVLEEEALSSIENWTDIIPEADVKTQIGVISELHQERENLANGLQDLKAELAESANKGQTEVAALRKQIEDKEALLRTTQRKLAESQASLSGSLLGVSGTSSLLNSQTLGPKQKTCTRCSKTYLEDWMKLSLSPTGIFFGDVCDECKAKVEQAFKK